MPCPILACSCFGGRPFRRTGDRPRRESCFQPGRMSTVFMRKGRECGVDVSGVIQPWSHLIAFGTRRQASSAKVVARTR